MDATDSLAEIELATGIPCEELRYVIDQKILPGGRRPGDMNRSGSRGRGTARTYTPFEAFGIACAALLLAAGLRRASVQRIMKILSKNTGERRNLDSVPAVPGISRTRNSDFGGRRPC